MRGVNWSRRASKVLVSDWLTSTGLWQEVLSQLTTKCRNSASVSTIFQLNSLRQQKKGTILRRMCSRRRKLTKRRQTSRILEKTTAWFHLVMQIILTREMTSKREEQCCSRTSSSAWIWCSSASMILPQRVLSSATRATTSRSEDLGGMVTNSISTWGSTAMNILRSSSRSTSPSWRGMRYLSMSIFYGLTLASLLLKYSSLTNQEQLLLVSISLAMNSRSSLKELVRCFSSFHPNPNDADLQFSRIRYCTRTPRQSLSIMCPRSTTPYSPRMRVFMRASISLFSVGMRVPAASPLIFSFSDLLSYSWLLLRQRMERHSAQTTRTSVQMASSGTRCMYSWSISQQKPAMLGLAETQPSTRQDTSLVISTRASARVSSRPFSVNTSIRYVRLHFMKYSRTSRSIRPCGSMRSTCSRKLTSRAQKLPMLEQLPVLEQSPASTLVYWMRQVTSQSMAAISPSNSSLLRRVSSGPQRLWRWAMKESQQPLRVSSTRKTVLLVREGFMSSRVRLSFCLLQKQSLYLKFNAKMQQKLSLIILQSAFPSSAKPQRPTSSASIRTACTLIGAMMFPWESYWLDSQSWLAVSTTPNINFARSSGARVPKLNATTAVMSAVNLASWWCCSSRVVWQPRLERVCSRSAFLAELWIMMKQSQSRALAKARRRVSFCRRGCWKACRMSTFQRADSKRVSFLDLLRNMFSAVYTRAIRELIPSSVMCLLLKQMTFSLMRFRQRSSPTTSLGPMSMRRTSTLPPHSAARRMRSQRSPSSYSQQLQNWQPTMSSLLDLRRSSLVRERKVPLQRKGKRYLGLGACRSWLCRYFSWGRGVYSTRIAQYFRNWLEVSVLGVQRSAIIFASTIADLRSLSKLPIPTTSYSRHRIFTASTRQGSRNFYSIRDIFSWVSSLSMVSTQRPVRAGRRESSCSGLKKSLAMRLKQAMTLLLSASVHLFSKVFCARSSAKRAARSCLSLRQKALRCSGGASRRKSSILEQSIQRWMVLLSESCQWARAESWLSFQGWRGAQFWCCWLAAICFKMIRSRRKYIQFQIKISAFLCQLQQISVQPN